MESKFEVLKCSGGVLRFPPGDEVIHKVAEPDEADDRGGQRDEAHELSVVHEIREDGSAGRQADAEEQQDRAAAQAVFRGPADLLLLSSGSSGGGTIPFSIMSCRS